MWNTLNTNDIVHLYDRRFSNWPEITGSDVCSKGDLVNTIHNYCMVIITT